MKLLAKIFGWSPAPPPDSSPLSQFMPPESGPGRQAANAARNNTRRELLRVVLRDTLNRQGIPVSWVVGESLISTSRTGAHGLYWRLLVRHWDPRLLTHAVALQQKLRSRVMTLDPLAANWLMGISWQFALPDESVCPAMPHPGVWTAPPPQAMPVLTQRATAAAPMMDVIAGPVRIPDPSRSRQDEEAEVRADLERLFALRAAGYKPSSGEGASHSSQFTSTQPMRLD